VPAIQLEIGIDPTSVFGTPSIPFPETVVLAAQDVWNHTLVVSYADGTIHAHVEDNSGRPMAGVAVYVYDVGLLQETARGISDASGNVSLSVRSGDIVVGLDPATVGGINPTIPMPESDTLSPGETIYYTFVVTYQSLDLRADINEDGKVDKDDLLILLGEWGQSVAQPN
jgi:hypothetical protein